MTYYCDVTTRPHEPHERTTTTTNQASTTSSTSPLLTAEGGNEMTAEERKEIKRDTDQMVLDELKKLTPVQRESALFFLKGMNATNDTARIAAH